MPTEHTPNSPSYGRLFLLLMVAAFVLRLGLAIAFVNADHADEVFQTREPAHRLVFGYGVVTWEWRDGIRSWIFPAILSVVMRAASWIAPGSQAYIVAISAFCALCSLVVVWVAYAWAYRQFGSRAAALAALIPLAWTDVVYYAAKPLSEVMATNLLLAGFYFAHWNEDNRRRLFVAGLLLGASVVFRVQIIPAVFLIGLLTCWKKWRVNAPALLCGMAAPVLFAGILDWITWSYPFQSWIRYFAINVISGRAAYYGTLPWYWYAEQLLKISWPLLILAAFAFLRSWRLLAVAAIIVLAHNVLSHKEYRYIYPSIALLAISAGMGFARVICWIADRRPRIAPVVAAAILVLFCFTSLALGQRYGNWTNLNETLRAALVISKQHDVCGVAVSKHWSQSGGYTYMHQRVPIYMTDTDFNADDTPVPASAFNYWVIGDEKQARYLGFKPVQCYTEICVFRREGGCVPDPEHELNRVLREIGD